MNWIFEDLLIISHDSGNKISQRDAQKREICARDGITLIVVPYWWNKSVQSIALAIHRARPDVQIQLSLSQDAQRNKIG